MNLEYSQHNFLPTLQFASLFGQYGLTTLIIVINSIIVYILINKNKKGKIIKSVIILFLIVISVLSYGFIKLQKTYTPNIDIALIQDETSNFDNYNDLISKIDENIDFILLPEYALVEYLDENQNTLNQINKITEKYNSYFIVGSKDKSDNEEELGYYNTVYLLNPNAEIIGKYYKMNPIQFFNDGEP